jgi:hypothetical protein
MLRIGSKAIVKLNEAVHESNIKERVAKRIFNWPGNHDCCSWI